MEELGEGVQVLLLLVEAYEVEGAAEGPRAGWLCWRCCWRWARRKERGDSMAAGAAQH